MGAYYRIYPIHLLAVEAIFQGAASNPLAQEHMASRPESLKGDLMVLPTTQDGVISPSDSLTVSSTTTSASAAFARSLFLFLGELLHTSSWVEYRLMEKD
jgi:hypothetical protein